TRPPRLRSGAIRVARLSAVVAVFEKRRRSGAATGAARGEAFFAAASTLVAVAHRVAVDRGYAWRVRTRDVAAAGALELRSVRELPGRLSAGGVLDRAHRARARGAASVGARAIGRARDRPVVAVLVDVSRGRLTVAQELGAVREQADHLFARHVDRLRAQACP